MSHHRIDDRDAAAVDREMRELVLDKLYEIHTGQRIIIRALAALHSQGDALMAVSKELQDALDRIDSATTAIGTRVTTIADQVKTGMSQQEVNDVVTKLNAEADKLNSIAADPNNPVPANVASPSQGGTESGMST